MLEELAVIVADVQFWVTAGVGVAVWWIAGAVIARIHYGASQAPLRAARAAAFWAVAVVLCATVIYAWFHWHDPVRIGALAIATLIVPLAVTLTLLRFEPTYEEEQGT